MGTGSLPPSQRMIEVKASPDTAKARITKSFFIINFHHKINAEQRVDQVLIME
jgi:hypothetical protein